MRIIKKDYIRKSEYKHVYLYKQGTNVVYVVRIPKYGFNKVLKDEKDAAKQVDLFLISIGKSPVNIYKKVS